MKMRSDFQFPMIRHQVFGTFVKYGSQYINENDISNMGLQKQNMIYGLVFVFI